MGRHYVEFCTYSPRMGAFGYRSREVSERDWEKVQLSETDQMHFRMEGLLGYRFFDRTDTLVNGEEIIGERENITCWTYFREALNMCQEKYGCNPEILSGDRII